MSRPTAPSPNIATLDSKIFADLCESKFFVDITPSTFIGTGADNALGAKVQIVSPTGVVIKPSTNDYDIAPPFVDVFEYSIPTIAGNFQYGKYIVTVEITDADLSVYDLSKDVFICEPDPANKTKKWGTLSATVRGVCKEGKVYINVDSIPNYRGKSYQERANAMVIKYPTASGTDPLSTPQPALSVQLYEGKYKITGTVCATYNFGDNVFVSVLYNIKRIKDIKCIIDEACVASRMYDLQLRINSGCSDKERAEIRATMDDGFRLLKLAQMLGENGEDPSDIVTQLEAVLGCSCTCNCNEGAPIINDSPVGDFAFEGCGFEENDYGLTKVITINNYDYQTDIGIDTGGVLTISEPALDEDNCKKNQHIYFSISQAYAQIKALSGSAGEDVFWSAIVKSSLNTLDLTCMGYTTGQLEALSLAQLMQLIITQSCGGAVCDATLTSSEVENVGADILLTFVAEAYSVDIYLDNVLKTNKVITAGVEATYTFAGAADGLPHTYLIIPKCVNGAAGTAFLSDELTFIGCPDVTPVSLSATSVSGATCPYDLTSLENSLVSGTTAEWHSANNHLASSLVAAPTSVSSGVYYVFARVDNCFSISQAVTIICGAGSACSSPQSISVATIVGGNRVQFIGAASPPPANSYTVKRKLASDPDVDGSYTTLGTPTYNSGTARWEILDATATNNTLYTYKAISNCPSTTPSVSVNYANMTCPVLTLTAGTTTVGYSFTGVGGGVDKYEVKIYNSAGTILIHTDTQLPAFASPITGTFTYLTTGSTYKVRIRSYIGTYYTDCAFVTATPAVNGTIHVLSGLTPLSQGYPASSGTIAAAIGTTVNVVLSMSGTDGAASMAYNVNGTTGTLTNGTSPLTLNIVMPAATIAWSLTLTTSVSSQTGDIGLS